MKNCECCDNLLTDTATFCNVCHTHVGEAAPRPGFEPEKYSEYYGFIIAGFVILLLLFAWIMPKIVDMNGEVMQAVGYVMGGISVISLIMKLLTKKSR